jgi:hypothetical protein
LLQTIHFPGESSNSSQNPKEGTVFILVPRKYRVNEKECNPVPGNMYGVMYLKKWSHKGNICKKGNGNPKNYTKYDTVRLNPTYVRVCTALLSRKQTLTGQTKAKFINS